MLAQLEMKKMLLDRMVHLLSRGCVVPVVQYMCGCFERRDTDMSLIRYFVTEVLDVVSPPFTHHFVQLFYPLVSNALVTGSMRTEAEHQLVTEFIGGSLTLHNTLVLRLIPYLQITANKTTNQLFPNKTQIQMFVNNYLFVRVVCHSADWS